MPRTPRCELPPEGIFHITARGVAGALIFTDDLDRLDFLSLLDRSRGIADWRCHAYCLLTNHYHLVLEATLSRLSYAMHRLNGVYALRFNRRHERRGHLFADRFSAWVVRDEEHLSATCDYVLANPVKAGLVDSIGDWPWAGVSSAGYAVATELRSRRTSSSGTSEKSWYESPTA